MMDHHRHHRHRRHRWHKRLGHAFTRGLRFHPLNLLIAAIAVLLALCMGLLIAWLSPP